MHEGTCSGLRSRLASAGFDAQSAARIGGPRLVGALVLEIRKVFPEGPGLIIASLISEESTVDLAETHDVTIDGGEIHEHCWRSPTDALKAHREGDIELVPPTFLTLLEISPYNSISEMEAALSNLPPRIFEPRVEILPEGLCYFYEGDAGYEKADHKAEGPRHRLYAKTDREWQYQRS